MFITNFQNPASEHAQALINFHNHIFFFLLIIISVIIWLLKLTFLFRIKNKNIFNKDILNKKNLIIFSWINLYIIKPLYRIFELIFKPSVLLYDNVNVYKFRWPKIIWYWIYVICEYIYKRYIIFYSKYLICSITNHILNINWIKNIIYNIYNIIYIVYNIIFQERFIKHIYVYKNLYNISHILAKLHMYMFNNRQITSSFNFYKEYMNCKKNFINSADYLYSKNFIFGTKLFMDVQKFYNLNKKKIYFNQLELYFFSKYSFSKYIAYIEFCYYIFNIIERQKLYSNVTNNKYNFLNLNFFEKFVSVSKFKRETFKTDKIFSYSRSVFFNNWIEVVFEKEHITEDDSDLEFYNGVYFSNLCLKTFNFLKQHKESNKANNNMIEVESIFNKETKCVESKFLPLYDAEKVFRKKSFWNENLKLNICSFKFLINSYIYSKIWSSSYMNFSQNKYKKYNYTFYNKILDSSSTHYNHSRYCNSSLYGKFILADVDYSYYLFHSNFKHSLKLEWIWTFIPISILMVILYPSLLLLYNYDKPYVTKPYLTIKAIGNQWYWSYEYTDNSIILDYNNDECTNKKLVSTNSIDPIKFDSYMLTEEDLELGQLRLLEVDRRLVLPVGVCIRIVTTSTDVLHSWAVPSLGVKIDSIPGRLNQFWLVINKPGVFYGQCSELCGVNHGFMPIAVEGVSLDQYYDYLYNYYTNN